MNLEEKKKITLSFIETFQQAGDLALHLRKVGLKKEIKSDNTPVTNGDIEVNKILTKKIKELTPNILIVSEENSDNKDNNNLDSTDFEQKVDEESTEGNPSSDGSEAEVDETGRIKALFATVDSNSHERPEAATARGELVVVEREFNEADQAVKWAGRGCAPSQQTKEASVLL